MRDLDLTSLRLFVAVCDTRNIARAAEQQALVGSAISKRLAALEDAVGTALLVRRRRGVEPTPAGETLLEHAREILANHARIERDMAAYAAGVRGQVRILATASAIAESLADDVAAFLKQPAHRDIRVDIEERVSTGVVAGVREGHAAVGLCWDAADFGNLHTRPWRSDHLSVVMPRSHPLATQPTLHLAQTLDEEHVNLPPNSAVQLMLRPPAALSGGGGPLRRRAARGARRPAHQRAARRTRPPLRRRLRPADRPPGRPLGPAAVCHRNAGR